MHDSVSTAATSSRPGSSRRKAMRAEASRTALVTLFPCRFRPAIPAQLVRQHDIAGGRIREEGLHLPHHGVEWTHHDARLRWFQNHRDTRLESVLMAQLGGNGYPATLANLGVNDMTHNASM